MYNTVHSQSLPGHKYDHGQKSSLYTGLRRTKVACLLLAVLSLLMPYAHAVEGAAGPEDFIAIEHPIVVNVLSSDQLHFLRFTTQFKLSDPALADNVKLHMPALKDALILLLSEKKYFEVTTANGKQQLRDDALAHVRKVMRDLTGDPTIESIFFTSLVVQ
jgi:flagellar FliL protein